ncbi:hypothetical protein RKLH11_1528 [Rhodobacteraceae bacterium KLH11]|nr:hypothetical protein RKLH11_1528 [Rhodobacteraceae bacterium KLH11]
MALAQKYTERASEQLQAVVNDALLAKGVSARQASFDIVGHDGLIRDIRAGRLPSIDKVQAIAEYFGLELYIGPPVSHDAKEDAAKRAAAFSDTERLAVAISAVEDGLSQSKRKMKPAKKAEVILLAYELLDNLEDESEEKIIRLIKAM